jgi:Raf kinase inhibitor-like YbhB/YbcL family protein
MRLGPSGFSDGSAIPRRFTCDGEDLSPPLQWSDAPAVTRSFVLLCDDPDAPAGKWHHWAAYNIPSTQHSLSEGGSRDAEQQGVKQAINDFHRAGYGGPCTPIATGRTSITSRCLRCRSTVCRSASHQPARLWSAKHASTPSPRRFSSASTSDDRA